MRPRYTGSRLSEKDIVHLWLGLSLGLAAFFGIWAWRKLTLELRGAAARQYSRTLGQPATKPAPPPVPLPAPAAK